MITLLDVSVLIALGDAGNVHEGAAMRFFEREAVTGGWATCPTTENAFLRILSHPSYPRTLGSPVEARRVLSRLTKTNLFSVRFFEAGPNLCQGSAKPDQTPGSCLPRFANCH